MKKYGILLLITMAYFELFAQKQNEKLKVETSNTSSGIIWLSKELKAGEISKPFLIAGWDVRIVWVHNKGSFPVNFTFQIDIKGDNDWIDYQSYNFPSGYSNFLTFVPAVRAKQMRVKTDQDTNATLEYKFAQNIKSPTDSLSLIKSDSKITIWENSFVKTKIASSPFTVGYYQKRTLLLSHNSNQKVAFMLEVDPLGNGEWMQFRPIAVLSGETMTVNFPKNLLTKQMRIIPDSDCKATATYIYK